MESDVRALSVVGKSDITFVPDAKSEIFIMFESVTTCLLIRQGVRARTHAASTARMRAQLQAAESSEGGGTEKPGSKVSTYSEDLL